MDQSADCVVALADQIAELVRRSLHTKPIFRELADEVVQHVAVCHFRKDVDVLLSYMVPVPRQGTEAIQFFNLVRYTKPACEHLTM